MERNHHFRPMKKTEEEKSVERWITTRGQVFSFLERREDIYKSYKHGSSIEDISRDYGLTQKQVKQIIELIGGFKFPPTERVKSSQ